MVVDRVWNAGIPRQRDRMSLVQPKMGTWERTSCCGLAALGRRLVGRGLAVAQGCSLAERGMRRRGWSAARGRGLAKRDEGVWELYFLSWALDGLL